jgi:hypothetical protein
LERDESLVNDSIEKFTIITTTVITITTT